MKYMTLFFIFILAAFVMGQAKPVGGTHFFTALAPNVYLAEPKFGGANSTIIITDEGVVVVDSQDGPAKATILIEEIARLTDKKIITVINSHWHGDHHGGNSAFLKANPQVRIISHFNTSRDIEMLATREIQLSKRFKIMGLENAKKTIEREDVKKTQSLEQVKQIKRYLALEESFIQSISDDFKFSLPTELLRKKRTKLKFGKTEIEIRSPGKAHTEGDLFVYLPKEKILITGDLLTSPYVVPRSGFPKNYSKVLAKMAKIKFGTLVPGHGTAQTNNKLLKLMADFLRDVHLLARSHIKSEISEKDGRDVAKRSENLQKYERQINWNDERGLKFLNYEGLIEMTYLRARKELSPSEN